ncbi:hypothetical protein MUO14_04560 [Halobacillus shinanisalinarum]|uniref:Uncharacterized protein n=1 Tax=Halobacillus shinanisalinarum TaxID=2932258 RepID=A0ABY4H1N4_9BACI|nr:hypothetical protein [Halobacillus shinanisalinarum]UOQ94239.1 hypothetical protein MUO14_04560 [Halobacillus shinanisalinarum]
MRKLKEKWVWLGPLLVILIGVSILFAENYQEVTEPPNESWSREVEIGSTPTLIEPHITVTKDGNISVSYVTKEGVQQKSLNETYQVVSENSYDIPYDKWTQAYSDGEQLIYSDYYAIYEGETKEKIADASQFIPLNSKVIYRQGQEISTLQPDTMESFPLLTLDNENVEISTYQTDSNTYLLTQRTDQAGIDITFYELTENQASKMASAQFKTKPSEVAESIQFTITDGQYALLLQTLQKQSMSGEPVYHYYFSQQTLNEHPKFTQIEFSDPVGQAKLTEVSDFEMKSEDGDTNLLFKAFGQTETGYRKEKQFNIYEATLTDNGVTSTTRLSNTPDSSATPEWINKEAIIWLDMQGDENRLLLSSSNPEIIQQAKQVSGAYLIGALGKTLGMLSASFLAIAVGVIWYIWPLVFIAVMMFSSNRSFDRDRAWVFFLGASIYLGAALLFKDLIFTSRLLLQAPEYLSFPGSSLFYIFIFALITYGILRMSSKDWSITVRLGYFVGVHILFITIFFGPYLT